MPKALLVPCQGEAPPTSEQLLNAHTRYPVLQAVEPEAKEWEARFLLMSDKYMAQTDNLGLCNGRFKTIEDWSEKTRHAAEAGGAP